MNKNANFWANVGANLSNLKALFAPPKLLKVFLGFVSVICVIGIIVAFALNIATKDKVYNANLTLHEQKIALDDKRNKINGEFSYTARIAFSSLAPLLRSSSISNVRVIKYAWDNAVDFNAFKGLTHSKRNVFFNSTQDLGALGLESLGIVEYRVDFSPLMKNILWRFVDIVIFVIVFFALWRVFVDLLHSLPTKNTASESTRALLINRKDYIFLAFAFLLCAGICAFTFWLGFPGFIIDSDTSRVLGFDVSNYGPVMNSLFIWLITLIFGKHTFYLFLLNLITLYLGIYFLIAGFYLRYKSIFSLAPLLIAFIGNIYLSNFISMNYVLMANFIFCAYSGILLLILAGERIAKKIRTLLWILIFALLFLGLLWRHNAIFSTFPAFFIIIYLWLRNRGLDSRIFIKNYAKLIALNAFLCLAIAMGFPKIFSKGSNPQNHLLLLQIAGACVPSDDKSCFKDSWYEKGANFDNVKVAYHSNPLNGDLYACWGGKIFGCGKLDGLNSAWIKAILKHPINYAMHEVRFFKAMWWQNPRDDDIDGFVRSVIKSPKRIQEKRVEWHSSVLKDYPSNEWGITFSPLQERIYTILYDKLPVLNHAIFVVWGFVLLIFSAFAILWQRKCEYDKSLLIFTFATSLTSFANAVIIAGMAIVTHSRYMSPVPIFSIIALVGFIALCLEIRAKRA